jgi:phosphodiesterase/alkaline phosphatase D-like protein
MSLLSYSHVRPSVMLRLKKKLTRPRFNVYDDHEITNNYAGLGNDSHPYANASDAWTLYNGAANPDALTKGEHYFDFRYGDVAFFVMDSRRYRSDVFTTEVEERTMLGETQLAALYEWLGKVTRESVLCWKHDVDHISRSTRRQRSNSS